LVGVQDAGALVAHPSRPPPPKEIKYSTEEGFVKEARECMAHGTLFVIRVS
jgi:hypothetical protein